ncbi:DNA polymerase III subunit gamma/tau [Alkalilimnicola sp. S0819]|uniref:DNA polymerase III subunit gamma/tau n=1 Tax=Alkalilimnicola sp. S0819 TaxID=2613922 RepID=UPI001261D6EF|nr:DNA polymerase III subunit gamma/tau [Alkalilimnicola sp. S0819]KAB7619744.1 DNA polymerase III subunit gamma/tau [Alkalilimnicola sp. S0819]MPQ17508.1 DNA polymerase III subunit gamma/tau [Alkalilimnicola sp. S0819]
MSYQALARKWRPRNFAELAGQEHVLRALVNGLERGQLHHAFLFTGTRGVGKTTIARILAKCLNCEQGVTAEPCGRCSACQEIDQGRFVDLIEVDAASRTKVDDTRELLDNVQYAPSRGRYKIYLIDEIHMFSSHSFNALLKTLEEPPPHVKFLLATTDPQKIPVTILSRCLQFSLKRLAPSMIANHLQKVLGEEGIEFEVAALQRLARAADGSMRDGLSLLDQAIAFGSGRVDEADTRAMLGDLEGDFVFELIEALANNDGPAMLAVIERMSERAPDYASVLAELLNSLHHIALAQTIPGGLGEEVADRERLQALAGSLAREDVQLYYQLGLHGRRDLPLAPDPRAGFEMAMLRMLAFRPMEGGAATAGQSAGQSAPPPRPATPRAAGGRPAPTAQTTPPAPVHTDDSGAAAPHAQSSSDSVAQLHDARASARTGMPAAAPASVPEPALAQQPDAPVVAPAVRLDSVQDWPEVVQRLPRGMHQVLASHCEFLAREGGRISLRIDPNHTHLHNTALEGKLAQALGEVLGGAVSLDMKRAKVEEATPAVLARQDAEARQQQAEQTIDADPKVGALRETFAAELVPGSIEPTD